MKQEVNNEYLIDLNKTKETIAEKRNKAMVIVNSTMIITYYRIGQVINKRKTWGNKYIERLSNDLREFGYNYSYENLKKIALFASRFNEEEIREQPVTQIPWGTIIKIMNKSSSKEEMLWYINQTHKNKWSRHIVLEQFEKQAYQRNIIAPQTSDDEYVKEITKDSLAFTFISEEEISSEKDLKNKLVDNIILFLQELGPGFALVGKEYRITVPSGKNFYIDLLMYHTKIHAYVVIEVKLDEIMPSDFGQLNFYINAINKYEKTDIDNDTVGIILCKNADKCVVETTLQGISNPIGVSK